MYTRRVLLGMILASGYLRLADKVIMFFKNHNKRNLNPKLHLHTVSVGL